MIKHLLALFKKLFLGDFSLSNFSLLSPWQPSQLGTLARHHCAALHCSHPSLPSSPRHGPHYGIGLACPLPQPQPLVPYPCLLEHQGPLEQINANLSSRPPLLLWFAICRALGVQPGAPLISSSLSPLSLILPCH